MSSVTMAVWLIILKAWEILQILTRLVNHTTDNHISLIARGGGQGAERRK